MEELLKLLSGTSHALSETNRPANGLIQMLALKAAVEEFAKQATDSTRTAEDVFYSSAVCKQVELMTVADTAVAVNEVGKFMLAALLLEKRAGKKTYEFSKADIIKFLNPNRNEGSPPLVTIDIQRDRVLMTVEIIDNIEVHDA